MMMLVPFSQQVNEVTLRAATRGDGYAADFVVAEVDAKDEGRDDMRDSAREMYVEQARQLLLEGPLYEPKP